MIEAIGFGILVPAFVAAGVTWLLWRLLREKAAARYISSIGLACGFLTGYALAIDGEWVPERNWHWLPYLGLLACIVGPFATDGEPSIVRRGSLFLLPAITAAAALVPEWTDRSIQIPGLALFLLIVLLLIDPLPRRIVDRSLLPLLYLCGFASAAFVAAKVSLTYGQLGGVAGAAFFGSSVVFWSLGETARIRGLLPAYVILIAGTAYVGCIYPDDPIYGLLLAPVGTLALWASVCGPVARLTGFRRTVVEYALVLLFLIGTAILLFAGSIGGDAQEW